MPWGEWKALYLDTILITGVEGGLETSRYGNGFRSGYHDRINAGQFAFPVDEDKLDGRLAAGEIVLTVENEGRANAFPLRQIGDVAANAEVGGEPVVVFTASGGRSVVGFSRVLDGREFNFEFLGKGLFADRETGTSWDLADRSVNGPLSGSVLDWVNTRRSLWFAVAISFPGIEIHNP